MSNPTWQDITPQPEPREVACTADPCTDPEHDHDGLPPCNQCGSENVELAGYDYGTDSDTGYHDAGEALICRNCRHVEQL